MNEYIDQLQQNPGPPIRSLKLTSEEIFNRYQNLIQQNIQISQSINTDFNTTENESHPWNTFLKARYDCIVWMHNQGKSDLDIADALSITDTQANLIRLYHTISKEVE